MIRTTMTMIAMTSKAWINPPNVNEVSMPSSHKTTRIAAIVHNIMIVPFEVDVISHLVKLKTVAS